MKRRGKTTEECIAEFEEVHGKGTWDYSKVEYVNASSKVMIRCPKHDEIFYQFPQNHRRGQVGCPQCFRRKLSGEEFKERALKKYGESRYDYSHTNYVDMNTKITVKCLKHGEFTQNPINHLSGREGCLDCKDHIRDTESFLRKAAEAWRGRKPQWDYSETEYTKQTTKVKIGCPEHGTFYQNPRSHVLGMVGCPGCHGMVISTEDFIERASEVFPNHPWKYGDVNYSNMKTYVTIKCEKHGEFTQSPEKHLLGKVGCSSCQSTGSSKKELELVEFVQSLGVEILTKKRGLLANPRLEVDIYVPSKKVAVEFNGIYYHSEKFRGQRYHYEKSRAAADVGIRLLQIWEDDWNLRREVVKEHIRQVLGVSKLLKISARNTEVVELSSGDARSFLEAHHIQGFKGATHYVGLNHKGELCAVAAFKKRQGDYELVRYATSANVRGGHSKVISYFERNFSYGKLVTFADYTFSDGGLYERTGWVKDGEVRPDYSYLVAGRREHKFNYRLKKFKEDSTLQYVEGMSESQLAELNGLWRVYDAGKARYVKLHPADTKVSVNL